MATITASLALNIYLSTMSTMSTSSTSATTLAVTSALKLRQNRLPPDPRIVAGFAVGSQSLLIIVSGLLVCGFVAFRRRWRWRRGVRFARAHETMAPPRDRESVGWGKRGD